MNYPIATVKSTLKFICLEEVRNMLLKMRRKSSTNKQQKVFILYILSERSQSLENVTILCKSCNSSTNITTFYKNHNSSSMIYPIKFNGIYISVWFIPYHSSKITRYSRLKSHYHDRLKRNKFFVCEINKEVHLCKSSRKLRRLEVYKN